MFLSTILLITYLFVGAVAEGAYIGDLHTQCPEMIALRLPSAQETVVSIVTWLPQAIGFGHTYQGPQWSTFQATKAVASVTCRGAGEPDDVYWFGFDCAHAWDLRPGSLATFPQWQSADEVYRSAGYVERECVHLAAQLKALST